MDVSAEDGDADGMLFGEVLDAVDEVFALLFVLVGCVVVVEIVEEVDAAVELVEEPTRDAEAFVQEFYRADEW